MNIKTARRIVLDNMGPDERLSLDEIDAKAKDLLSTQIRILFRAKKNDDGADWLIASTGTDEAGGEWTVNTNSVHASELHHFSEGAKEDAKLIARLLNWYYNDPSANKTMRVWGF